MTSTIIGAMTVPQIGWTHLRAARSWSSHSAAAFPRATAVSVGIGGLRTTFSSDLRLTEPALSYDGKILSATVGDTRIEAVVAPIELAEAVHVVQSTSDSEFEVSADQGLAGMYVEGVLRETTLGFGFSIADLDFSLFAYDKRALPKGAPKHPYVQGVRLLDVDPDYAALPGQWQAPPMSWPQIFVRFDPKAPLHVQLEFNPQMLFRDLRGNIVEVDPSTLGLAERPYLDMVRDVAERPGKYLERSPALAHAAETTIALGLLRAACSAPGSCANLIRSALGGLDEEDLKVSFAALEKKYTAIDRSYQKAQKRDSATYRKFVDKWSSLGSQRRSFVVADEPRSWALAFDAVNTSLDGLLATKSRAAARKLLRKLAPQFALPVPQDALLIAASAVVDANSGDAERARAALVQALDLSRDYPLDRISVTELGAGAAVLLRVQGLDDEGLLDKMLSLHERSQVAAYDEIEAMVAPCVQKPRSCVSKDVRTWEGEIANGGMKSGIKDRDVPYLQGRIDYVIGVLEPKGALDRRRFLEQRVAAAQPQHREELTRLEQGLRATIASR